MTNTHNPLISIIIPYYNCAKYIEETLQSIEQQSYTNFEVILVNDGSDQANTAFLEKLLEEKSNIQYIYQENKGVSSARNAGARLAQGDFLLFLDADNKIHTTYLEKTSDILIHNPNCKITYTKAEFFEAQTGEWILPPYDGFKNLLQGNMIDMLALIRRFDFIKLGGFDENLQTHEDWDYWIRLLQDDGKVIRLNEILYSYRKRITKDSLMDILSKNPKQLHLDWQKIYIKHSPIYITYDLSYFDLIKSNEYFAKQNLVLNNHIKTLENQMNLLSINSTNQEVNFSEQLNQLNSQISLLHNNNLALLSQLKNQKKKLITKIQLLNNQLNELHNKNTQIEEEKVFLNAEIEKVTTQLHTLVDENTHIHHEIARLHHSHQTVDYRFAKYKSLAIIRLLKPLIKIEQNLHSLNRYRKAFRLLMREKGSFGKAYQTVRRHYKANNLKLTKKYLKDVLNGQFTPSNPTQSNTQDKNWDIFDITNNEAYQLWIKRNDTLDEDKILSIKQQMQSFKNLPKISILMPVYNVDVRYLIEAINSILNQIYTNWELCISDDASPNQDIRPILEKYQKQDSRIKVILRESNGHISENSNSALTLATGEWLALMDHDDVLPIHALFEIAKTVQNHPNAQLIYSDEDKIDGNNHRFMPHFKSDFNLDLLYSQNYISHLGVYKTTIAKDIGGFRKGFEGSQDYDFLLRYLLKIDIKNIIHIPKILYHWRAIEGSTALAAGEKSYTTEAGILALTEHFKSLNKEVTVSRSKVDNTYRIKWHLSRKPLVSLIIPTKNGYDITKQAIDSILNKTTYQNYEIVLVDNNSDDPKALEYFLELEKHPKIQVLRYPYPFNYSAINNFAAQYANGEVIGLINNDIEVINNEWLDEMVSQAMRPDIGCVGAMLYYPNDTIQHAGVIIGIGGVAGHSHKYYPKNHHGYFSRLYLTQNLMAVTAACLLVRKEIFENVKGLNEKDLTVAFNDVDFCLKVHKAGYRNLWTPFAELYHHESISRGAEDNPEKIARFNKEIDYMIATWQTNQASDPYYNPNLSLITEDFAITMQSRIDILD